MNTDLKFQKLIFLRAAYKELFSFVQKNSEDLYENCRRVLGAVNEPYVADIRYLLDYFGVVLGNCGRNCERYNSQPVLDVMRAGAKFVQNVFPFQRKNFSLTTNISTTNAYYNLYASVPPEIEQFAGDDIFETVRYPDVELKLNGFLSVLTEYLSSEIDVSYFHEGFLRNVIAMLISQCVWLVRPKRFSNGVCFTPLDPLSVIPEHNDRREQIAYCRQLQIRRMNYREAYPNAIKEPSNWTTNDKRASTTLFDYCFEWQYKGVTFWGCATFDEQRALCNVSLFEYCPYIVIAESLPQNSDIGYGNLLFLAKDIRITNDQRKTVFGVRDFNMDLPWEIVRSRISERHFKKSNDLVIKKGSSYEVKEPGAFNRFQGIDETPFDVSINEQNQFITRAILGEQLNLDPQTKATLTNAQLEQQAQFFMSSASKTIYSLVSKIVQSAFLVLKSTGRVYQKLGDYFNSPKAPPAEWISYLKQLADEKGDHKGIQFVEDVYQSWIMQLVDTAGDLSEFQFDITSPAGMKQSLEDNQTFVSFLSTISNVLQKPVSEFASENRVVHYIADKFGIDETTLLSEKEITERDEARKEAIQQQQELELARQEAKEGA